MRIAEFIYDKVENTELADRYRVALIRNTRPHRAQGRAELITKEYLKTGISPRGNFHLEAVARTFAFFQGDAKVTPDHVKAVARPVMAHRLILKEGMEFVTSNDEVLEKIIKNTEIPPCK